MADTTKKRSKLGHKEEIRPGVWEIRVSHGYTRSGGQRRKQVTIEGTEHDAEVAVIKLAVEMGKRPTLGDCMTLDEYFWAYFSPGRHASTTRANAMGYDGDYRNHISEALGRLELDSIDNWTVQNWIDGLPPQSAPAYVRELRAIMNQARFDHATDSAVMRDYRYRLPRGRKKAPLPAWGAREVAACIDRLRGDGLYALWLVMTGAGLSRSEALAVDWESIIWEPLEGGHWNAWVPVGAAYTAKDGMKEPKNDRRYRRAPMRPRFADPLHAIQGSGPICKGARGGRRSPNSIPKAWKALFSAGAALDGLPFVPIGRMRATHAGLMQRSGASSSVINAMQGRSEDSRVLYSNYLAVQEATYADAADRMDALLG